jgi:hypothetical protein
MDTDIKTILYELYDIDPSFREKEAELVKIIEKLFSSRPDVKMDEDFKRKLKTELLKKIEQKETSLFSRLFSSKKKAVLRLGFGFASVGIIVIVFFILFPPISLNTPAGRTNTIAQEKSDNLPDKGLKDKVNDNKKPEIIPKISESKNEHTEIAENEYKSMKKEKTPAELDWSKSSSIGNADKKITTRGGDSYYRSENDTNITKSEEMAPAEKTQKSDDFLSDQSGKPGQKPSQDKDSDKTTKAKSKTGFNAEKIARIVETKFLKAISNPLSTFSMAVDTASYTTVRQYIGSGELPPPDAVRIEELINYFSYDYPKPVDGHPFAFYTEVAACPWESSHKLVLIGIQVKSIDAKKGETLPAIAKNATIQVELNPALVESYRLIGYSDRVTLSGDFADNIKDAGEPGDSVTVFYEIVPVTGTKTTETLTYKKLSVTEQAIASDKVMTLRLRYGNPDSETSELIETAVKDSGKKTSEASENFRFAAAVAEWGLILSKSEYMEKATITQVLELGRGSIGHDSDGSRKEFISLVDDSRKLIQ